MTVISVLKKHYPTKKHYLHFSNPLELLVGTILSAQCTDERVNKVTQVLFKKYTDVKDYANVPLEELEQDIRSTGFYKSKAKRIQGAAQKMLIDYGGKVPQTMDELTSLPGIARKSANAIMQNMWGTVEGVIVDTHVIRLANRLGLSSEKDAVKIEKDLMREFQKEDWPWIPFLFKTHGQKICKAPTPMCSECFLHKTCPKIGVKRSK